MISGLLLIAAIKDFLSSLSKKTYVFAVSPFPVACKVFAVAAYTLGSSYRFASAEAIAHTILLQFALVASLAASENFSFKLR